MTDQEIDSLSGASLEAAYAEQVLGYVYKPGKTERKPWHYNGYPCLESLPHYLGQDVAMSATRGLVNDNYPFLDRHAEERFHIQIMFRPDWASACITFVEGGKEGCTLASWYARGLHLGEAFLRAMLKAAE